MKGKTILKLNSDNFNGLYTPEAYAEICLQMSSGDHGSHKAQAIVVPENSDDYWKATSNSREVLWDAKEQYLRSICTEENTRECGYDLCEIEIEALREFWEEWGLTELYKSGNKHSYIANSYYIGDGEIEVRFGAHPFANGLLADISQGTRGEGYCSYIGVKGPSEFVEAFKKLVRDFGNPKGYSDTPDYI